MLLANVRNWLGSSPPDGMALARAAASLPLSASAVHDPSPTTGDESAPVWTPARIALAERLWGEGFLRPGEAEETMALARPLPLVPEAKVLLLGAGIGGSALTLAARLGAHVRGFEADLTLAALGAGRCAAGLLGRRTTVESWSPAAPLLPVRAFHHALVIEPLHGARPEPVLSAVKAALKPNGQVTLAELVAHTSLDRSDPELAAWCRAERRGRTCHPRPACPGCWAALASRCARPRT